MARRAARDRPDCGVRVERGRRLTRDVRLDDTPVQRRRYCDHRSYIAHRRHIVVGTAGPAHARDADADPSAFRDPPAARPVPTSVCLGALTAEDQYEIAVIQPANTRPAVGRAANLIQFTTSGLAKVVNARKMFLSHGYGPSFVMVRDLSDLAAEHSAVLSLSRKQDLAGFPAVNRKLQLSLAQYAVDADAYPRVCST